MLSLFRVSIQTDRIRASYKQRDNEYNPAF